MVSIVNEYQIDKTSAFYYGVYTFMKRRFICKYGHYSTY